MKLTRFNDFLALIFIMLSVVIWILASQLGRFRVPEAVLQFTILACTIIVYHYFRKAGPTPPAP